MTSTPPPSPTATDEATFVAELRRLRTWSGRSFRQLERRAAAAGDSLPYSTAATVLAKDRLPRAEVVAAFVRACGVHDAGPWLATRARIADGTVSAPAGPASRRAPWPGWRRAVAAAAALVVAFAGGAVFDTVATSEAEEEVQVGSP